MAAPELIQSLIRKVLALSSKNWREKTMSTQWYLCTIKFKDSKSVLRSTQGWVCRLTFYENMQGNEPNIPDT